LKAVVLAAGRSKSEGKYAFPEDSKPKCLFHSGGKTLLEIMVSILRSVGIENIRIVTGYHRKEFIINS